MLESTSNDNDTLDTEVVVPLKYLGNFWRRAAVTVNSAADLHQISQQPHLCMSCTKKSMYRYQKLGIYFLNSYISVWVLPASLFPLNIAKFSHSLSTF